MLLVVEGDRGCWPGTVWSSLGHLRHSSRTAASQRDACSASRNPDPSKITFGRRATQDARKTHHVACSRMSGSPMRILAPAQTFADKSKP